MVSPLYTFEGLLTAGSHAEIAAFMERHAGNLGYGRFFYSPLLVAGDARHFFKDDHNVVAAEMLYTKNIFSTYPASWIRRYQEAGHVAADPVVKLITTSNLPIHWDAVVTAEEAGMYKPDPLPYRLALDKLGVGAHEAAFVAGSSYDMFGTAAVGLRTYWHNRVGLPLVAGAQPPEVESPTLDALVPWLNQFGLTSSHPASQ